MTSCVLETIYFPGNHTAIHISEKIKEVLHHYNSGSEQILAIVHDKVSNATVLASIPYNYLLYFAWADQRVQPFYNYHI